MQNVYVYCGTVQVGIPVLQPLMQTYVFHMLHSVVVLHNTDQQPPQQSPCLLKYLRLLLRLPTELTSRSLLQAHT